MPGVPVAARLVVSRVLSDEGEILAERLIVTNVDGVDAATAALWYHWRWQVEQDHRAINRIVRPMLGFKTFNSARRTLRGIELMHMIKKGQMVSVVGQDLSAAGQFYSLAA